MAKCNIFKTLSSGSAEVSNGSVLMLSQWANDLTKHMNDGDAYKVVPARFAAFNIDYDSFTAPAGATADDKNKSVPEIFQNYIENASAFLRAEYSNDTEEFGSEENNTTEWNPNAFSLVFWDAMNNFFNVTADNSSVTNGEGVANALYFVGDIDIVQDAPVDGYSYSEIKCILNNEDRRRAYVWEQNDDSKTTDAFPSKDYTNIDPSYIFGWNETTYPTNDSVLSYSPVFVDSNDKYGGVNPVLPQILNPFIDDIGESEPIDTNNNTYFDEIADDSEDYVNPMEMNTFVVFYDVITKNGDSEYEYKYRSIPLCVYFTGPVAEEGEQGATTDVMQNPVQKYVSSSAAYGQGTSYGLSIATRCTVLPNMTLENGEAPVTTLNDYPEFAMVMSAFAEAIEELDKVQGEQEETNDLLKNHLAQFKDRKTNVPYIREINNSKYWFVNGRNTGAKAEGEASSLEDLNDVDIAGAENGDALVYNSSTGKWEAEPVTPSITVGDREIEIQKNGTKIESFTTNEAGETKKTINVVVPTAVSQLSDASTYANQNAFSTISVSGQPSITADSTTDTLSIAAGANAVVTTNSSTDTLTIASTDEIASESVYIEPVSPLDGVDITATNLLNSKIFYLNGGYVFSHSQGGYFQIRFHANGTKTVSHEVVMPVSDDPDRGEMHINFEIYNGTANTKVSDVYVNGISNEFYNASQKPLFENKYILLPSNTPYLLSLKITYNSTFGYANVEIRRFEQDLNM